MAELARRLAVLPVVVFTVTVSWVRFNSTTYPYSVQQPSSYRHVVIQDTAGHSVDYFFPSLGSFTTNVNIVALAGKTMPDESVYLRSMGGLRVRHDGTVPIMGLKMNLTRADFKGIVGRWTIEQVCFVDGNLLWRLTASYDIRYSSLRTTLLRILSSFQLRH